MTRAGSVALALASAWVAAGAGGATPERPIDVGRVEAVEVRLVLIDLLALDRRDRTVGDLRIDELELRVDGRRVGPVSLDGDCSADGVADPRGGAGSSATDSPQAGPVRTFVHAFDYYHVGLAAEVLERARESIERMVGPGERHMIVSLGSGLRVEAPFTADAGELAEALQRMTADRSLYAAHLGRLTERRAFARIASLIDALEPIEGPKIVILYSGPFARDGFHHDPEFRRIASRAARARVAFYPVDTGGLRTPVGFRYGDLGGPKTLARLAVESGGRVTYHTNDLGLALARARRDVACRYTLGFHDPAGEADAVRRVTIDLGRPGVRVVHPAHYVVRSDTARLQAMSRTAEMVPEMFDPGPLKAEALAFRPVGADRWEVRLFGRIDPERTESPAVGPWRIRGRLMTDSGAAAGSFRRTVEASAASEATRWVESVEVGAGDYRVAIVAERDGLSAPHAIALELRLENTPDLGWFVVGPHLGRSSLRAPTDETGFEPRLGGAVGPDEPLAALTWLCRAGPDATDDTAVLERWLHGPSGNVARSFEPVTLEPRGGRRVRCSARLDGIAIEGLAPGRHVLRVAVAGREAAGKAAFEVAR